MRIKSGVGSVVGQIDDSHWGQVLLTPNAYGVVEISDSRGIARREGIQLLTDLTEKLAEGVGSLGKLAAIIQSVPIHVARTVVLLVPFEHVCYIVLRGKGRVYLKRGDKLATLLSGEGAISGELRVGDTVLLVSEGFIEAVPDAKLMAVFDHLSPQDVAEKLTLLLHETDGWVGAAALVFQVMGMAPESDVPESTTVEPVPERQLPMNQKKSVLAGLRSIFPPRVRHAVGRLRGNDRQSRVFGILAFGAVLLFVISVILGVQKQAQGVQDQKLSAAMKDARFAFEEGTALLELNAIKGRERLSEAKAMLDPYLQQTPEKSPTGRELRALYKDISDNLTQAMKIYHVSPEFFYDVTLLKKGAVAHAMAISGDELGILDRQASTVYTVTLTTKKGAMLASGGDLTGAMYIARSDDIVYVETEKGIVAVDAGAKSAKLVVSKPDQWKAVSAMTRFDGNLYLLDTGAGRIWKYVAAGAGLSDTREYLNPDVFPDLSHGATIAVDGSVWIATTDGKILKFTQGKEDTFVMLGIEPPLGSTLRLVTDAESKNLYILDIQGKRVVVLQKDGIYLAQYTWDESLGVADFGVSEPLKKILLLSEGKIFGIDIQ